MTAGYLWLRFVLFGQVVAREPAERGGPGVLRRLFEHHLAHVVTGDVDGWTAAWSSCWRVAVVADLAARAGAQPTNARLADCYFFGPVWWIIGVAPIAVAGYESPRHVYLAAAGWAMVLAIASTWLWRAPGRVAAAARDVGSRRARAAPFYIVPLHGVVREWNTMAAVSQHAVQDVRAEVLSSPAGTLIVVGAPTRSWEWAVPFCGAAAVTRRRPDDARVHRLALARCTAAAANGSRTRGRILRWSRGPRRDSAVGAALEPGNRGAFDVPADRDNLHSQPLIGALLTLESAGGARLETSCGCSSGLPTTVESGSGIRAQAHWLKRSGSSRAVATIQRP